MRPWLLLTLLLWACDDDDSSSDAKRDGATVDAQTDSATADAQAGSVDAALDDAQAPAPPSLVINEVSCGASPWVEVQNTGAVPVSLLGVTLHDGRPELAFAFSDEALAPGAFAVAEPLAFGLTCGDDRLTLQAGAAVLDVVDVSAPALGETQGRLPDGVGALVETAPTKGGPNAAPVPPRVRINEVDCAEDAVELVNAGASPVSLAGFILTDAPDDPTHRFALSGTLAPGGFAVFTRQTEREDGFPFGLAAGEDTLRLFAPDGTLQDELALPATPPAYTTGRLPDGEGDFVPTDPTLGGPNRAPSDPSESLFDPFALQVFHLTLSPDAMMALEQEPREFVEAGLDLATADGETVHRTVGVHLKGVYGSFRPLGSKSGFRLKFTYGDGTRFRGLKRLVLNNMVQDPSRVAEFAAYSLFRAVGVPAPRVGYAWVTVNDQVYGLYALIEPYDEVFLDRHFETTSHLYEGSYGTDLFTDGLAGFETDEGEEDQGEALRPLAEAVANPEGFAERAPLNLDVTLSDFAVEIFTGHWDGYAPTRNNYYIHLDEQGLATFMPWGTDQTFRSWPGPYEGQGLAFQACVQEPACRDRYDRRLAAVLRAAEALHLEETLPRLAEHLAPLAAESPMDENSPEWLIPEANATVDFIRDRIAQLAPVVACIESDDPDPDGDGFACATDCDNENPEIYPGAVDVCGDGVDQDCNGRPDDGPDCPDCQEVRLGSKRYFVCPNPKTYDQAIDHCASVGANLVRFDDDYELWWLLDQARQFREQDYWAGLSDREEEGRWVSPDGTEARFFRWEPGQPDDWNGEENCAEVYYWSLQWNDLPCEAALGVLCEAPCVPGDRDGDGVDACDGDCDDDDPDRHPGLEDLCEDGVDQDCTGQADDAPACDCVERTRGDHTYWFCARSRNYDDALRTCEALNAHPVWLEDEREAVWVTGRAGELLPGNPWIGFTDRAEEGSFIWGEPGDSDATFTRWADGEPNDVGGEDCTELMTGEGYWNDRACFDAMPCICESR